MTWLRYIIRFWGKLRGKYLILALASISPLLSYDIMLNQGNNQFEDGDIRGAYLSYCAFFLMPDVASRCLGDYFCATAGRTACLEFMTANVRVGKELCQECTPFSLREELNYEWKMLKLTVDKYSQKYPDLWDYMFMNSPCRYFISRFDDP